MDVNKTMCIQKTLPLNPTAFEPYLVKPKALPANAGDGLVRFD